MGMALLELSTRLSRAAAMMLERSPQLVLSNADLQEIAVIVGLPELNLQPPRTNRKDEPIKQHDPIALAMHMFASGIKDYRERRKPSRELLRCEAQVFRAALKYINAEPAVLHA